MTPNSSSGKILHLCMDHNFVSDSRRVFEKYYPGLNIFVVNTKTPDLKMIKDKEGFICLDLYDRKNYAEVLRLCRENNIGRIVLHGMRDYMLFLLRFLRKECDFRVFWIVWGYELYETLGYEKGYRLFDRPFPLFSRLRYYTPNSLSRIIRKVTNNYRPGRFAKIFGMVDYFCFWNKRDYELLKNNFDVKAGFRFFSYNANETDSEPADLFELRVRKLETVMINHQASVFGNHEKVFERLKEIDRDNTLQKIVPLSYGHPMIRSRVLKSGQKKFGRMFRPVTDYMSRDEYFRILDRVDVAVFGQRRQEASGNIIQLLKNGVKVFLRNDNNLLDYYREKGYLIYSFDDDLNDMESLKPLTIEEQRHNRECFMRNRLYYDRFMPHLLD